MNNQGSIIGNMFKVTCVAGGLSLLCGTSFMLGRVRGWFDAAALTLRYLDAKKKADAEKEKSEQSNDK